MKLRRALFVLLTLGLLAVPAVAYAAPLLQEGHGGDGANFFNLIPLIIVFPLLGLLINMVAGKRMSENWVGIIASSAAGLSFLIAVLQALSLQANGFAAYTHTLADWIVIGDLHIPWAFQVDTLSVAMMLVVTGVGTLIHIYAIGYEHSDVRHNGDPGRYPRFFIYLNLFLAAMLILVTGNNYLMLFVGWEGVGLCSFLLIGFWFEKGANNVGNARAARKAFIANRVGDWAMLLAMFLIFWMFGSLTFDNVFGTVKSIRLDAQGQMMVTAITLLLLVGAAGKSAQVPLYVWLPDAMAGPTPVSALIHAATMVTAGIYMITRSNALFALSEVSMNTVAWVGAITALFAATIAVGQTDIKKVLAYSTISQLGFMVAAVGLGGYVAGMFHLITHAFFKALLFLSSGSVIHAMEHGMHELHAHGGGGHDSHDDDAHGHDEHGQPPIASHHLPHFDPQDMRNMGGLWSKLPVTRWVYLIGALALAGIFPFAGFWSKDEILLDAFNHNQTIYWMLTIAAGFTAFYMTRQIWMVFFGKPRTPEAKHAGESPLIMTAPLVALAVLSLWGGALNLPTIGEWHPTTSLITPYGSHGLGTWLDYTLHPETTHETAETTNAEGEAAEGGATEVEGLNFQVAGLSTAFALGAILLGFLVYRAKPATVEEPDPLQGMLGPVFNWLRDKWYVDEIYQALILGPYDWLARFTADVIDWRFWHDWFHDKVLAGLFNTFARLTAEGVDLGFIDAIANGLADLSKGIAARFSRLQAGYVRGYAMAVFLGVVMVLGYFLYNYFSTIIVR